MTTSERSEECPRSPGRSATSPSSATAGRARPRSSRRCSSRPARSTVSARSRPGTTVTDWDEDEQQAADVARRVARHLEWQGRKINLIDTPGDSGFQADTIASLRVVEGALVVVSGVMGVEVNTARVWARAEELELSRVVFVNMLDRERADFYRTLDRASGAALRPLRRDPAPDRRRARADRHRRPAPQLRVHGSRGRARGRPGRRFPAEMAELAAEYREKLLDAVVETDEALMESYLAGEELDPHDGRGRAQDARSRTTSSTRSPAASRRRTSARTRCSTCSSRASPRRRARARRSTRAAARPRSSSRRSPTRSPGGSRVPRLRRHRSPPTRRSSTSATTRRSGSAG